MSEVNRKPSGFAKHTEVSPDSDPEIVVVTMVNIQNTMEIPIFNGKIHYKFVIFNSYVKLPERSYYGGSDQNFMVSVDQLIDDGN